LDRGLLARLVFGPDIATTNCEAAVPIQRHEDTREADLSRVIDQRPLLERFHRNFELTEPRIDLLGVFILAGVLLLQRTILGQELRMKPVSALDQLPSFKQVAFAERLARSDGAPFQSMLPRQRPVVEVDRREQARFKGSMAIPANELPGTKSRLSPSTDP
jgi:hypothetical protein